MSTETITWRRLQDAMPDADLTVLLFMPTDEDCPAWPGYWDGEIWRLADGMPAPNVVAWADMPEGPK